jgi:hypothetical protein
VGVPAGPVSHSITNEWRQALRRLRLAPMFTVITPLTLAAGGGANTVVFSVPEGGSAEAFAVSAASVGLVRPGSRATLLPERAAAWTPWRPYP